MLEPAMRWHLEDLEEFCVKLTKFASTEQSVMQADIVINYSWKEVYHSVLHSYGDWPLTMRCFAHTGNPILDLDL